MFSCEDTSSLNSLVDQLEQNLDVGDFDDRYAPGFSILQLDGQAASLHIDLSHLVPVNKMWRRGRRAPPDGLEADPLALNNNWPEG
jgi:hypothetical protein